MDEDKFKEVDFTFDIPFLELLEVGLEGIYNEVVSQYCIQNDIDCREFSGLLDIKTYIQSCDPAVQRVKVRTLAWVEIGE